jgi:hypothetical protein
MKITAIDSRGNEFKKSVGTADDKYGLIFPANWKKFGRRAGFVRNTDIAKISTKLIAEVAEDRKGGTEDTISKFIKFQHGQDVNLYLC